MRIQSTLGSCAFSGHSNLGSIHNTPHVGNTDGIANSNIAGVEGEHGRTSGIRSGSGNGHSELASRQSSGLFQTSRTQRLHGTSLHFKGQSHLQGIFHVIDVAFQRTIVALSDFGSVRHREHIQRKLRRLESNFRSHIAINVRQRRTTLTTGDGNLIGCVGNTRSIHFIKREDFTITTLEVNVRIVDDITIVLRQINSHLIHSS